MNWKGFTLIELLIVVAIIGILSMVAVPSFIHALTRAKVARANADLKTMENAILQYMVDNNEIPLHSHGLNQNYWLTTPIAYLSGFLYDPFQQVPDAKQMFEGELITTKKQYHWDPYDMRYHILWEEYFDASINPDFAARKQASGIIFGFGPALKYISARSSDWHPYEISNGLYSIGVIRRYVPGKPNVDFPLP